MAEAQQSTAASARPGRPSRSRAATAADPTARGPGGTSKKDTIKRTFKEFSADNGTDWAAALTYYGVLAIFPALIALVSILGPVRRVGHRLADSTTSARWRPGPAKDILTSAIENLQSNQGAAGVAFVSASRSR